MQVCSKYEKHGNSICNTGGKCPLAEIEGVETKMQVRCPRKPFKRVGRKYIANYVSHTGA